MPYSDRLDLYHPSMGEALQYSLPPIDVMTQLFHDQIKDAQDIPSRVILALQKVDMWREKADISLETEDDIGQSEALSLLFLDAVALVGNERQLHEMPLAQHEARREQKRKIVSSTKVFQGHIDTFLEAFGPAPAQKKYQALEAIMYEATCQLFDLRDLSRSAEQNNTGTLVGMIAENKLLRITRENGWPLSRYGTPDADVDLGTDIVVMMGPWQLRQFLDLQVKGVTNGPDGLYFEVDKHHRGRPRVYVSVDLEGDPFGLSDQDKNTYVQGIKDLAFQRGLPQIA